MKILGIQDITEAETIRVHVEAGGTVAADGTLEPPRLQGEAEAGGTTAQQAVAAVADALRKPPVVITDMAHAVASENQLRAQNIEAQIKRQEAVVERETAVLADLFRAHRVAMASVDEFHSGS